MIDRYITNAITTSYQWLINISLAFNNEHIVKGL
jgi:hypothetical protein